MTIQIVPTYGRDYQSKQAFINDLKKDKDFQIMDVSNRWNGKPVTLKELQEAGYTEIKIRYNKLQRVAIIRTEDL